MMDIASQVDLLLRIQKHMVVSTVNSEGNPQSSLVGFASNEKLELIFGTDVATRKSQNIKNNPKVSIVINGDNECVQYEGTASLLTGAALEKFFKIFFTKIPSLEKYSKLPNQVYYKINPTWIRFIDHNYSPGKITEMNLPVI